MPSASRTVLSIVATVLLSGCVGMGNLPDRQVAAQLYTVRADMERDALATLRRVASTGYNAVEYAGTFGNDPASLCRETRRLGLRVSAAHADWRQLRDDPASAFAEAKTLCADTVVLAWIPEEERRTLSQWQEWIARLNALVPMARTHGLTLAYHAHDFEFALVDGVRPIDLLMQRLDPAIGFELDVYWAAKAGIDSLDFLRNHSRRITHLHLKDMAADGSMADVGDGQIDIAAIVAQAELQGVRHLVVERDDAPDPWASLARSLDSMRAIPLQRGTSTSATESELP